MGAAMASPTSVRFSEHVVELLDGVRHEPGVSAYLARLVEDAETAWRWSATSLRQAGWTGRELVVAEGVLRHAGEAGADPALVVPARIVAALAQAEDLGLLGVVDAARWSCLVEELAERACLVRALVVVVRELHRGNPRPSRAFPLEIR